MQALPKILGDAADLAQQENSILGKLLSNIQEGVYFVDRTRKITFWNEAAEKITGYKLEEVKGSCCGGNILMHTDAQGHEECASGCPLKTVMEKPNHDIVERSIYLRHKEGYRLPVLTRTLAVFDEKDAIVGALQIFRPTSTQAGYLEQIEELQKMAYLDTLTGIANRRFLERDFTAKISALQRGVSMPFGLLLMDIDNFKKINDQYGHLVGDRALQTVAKTLSLNMRPFDLVGRWGGEEFMALVANVNTRLLAETAERLRALVGSSVVHTPEKAFQVTISSGGMIVEASENIELLFEKVDALLYESKHKGKNCVTIG